MCDATKRSVVQKYTTAAVSSLLQKVAALKKMRHPDLDLPKGELTELFVASVLRVFLPKQLEVGTGIIVNQHGRESRQIDIIISDNSAILPFVKEGNLGVYPIEAVLGTIEVKTTLTKGEIEDAADKANELKREIFRNASPLYDDEFDPICCVLGFNGSIPTELKTAESAETWYRERLSSLFGICVAGKYSYLKGALQEADEHCEETKRFVAIMLDKIRSMYFEKLSRLLQCHTNSTEKHRDWIGIYTRDQVLKGRPRAPGGPST